MRIIQQAREKEEEIEVQDGFDLYKELAETRLIYADALPGYASVYSKTIGSFSDTDPFIDSLSHFRSRSFFLASSGAGFE